MSGLKIPAITTLNRVVTASNLEAIKNINSPDVFFIRRKGEPKPFYLGVELEYALTPNTFQSANIVRHLGVSALSTEQMESEVRKELANLTPLCIRPMFPDQGNSELALHPCSFHALHDLKTHLNETFFVLRNIGFTVDSYREAIGLHVSVDRTQVNQQTFERIIRWMIANSEIWTLLSNRRGFGTQKSDPQYLLGNWYRNWKPKQVQHKLDELIRLGSYSYSTWLDADVIGIRLYRTRPYIQFTHFGSTLETDTFLSCVQLVHGLVTFCQTNNSLEIGKFLEFLQENSFMYQELRNRLALVAELLPEGKNLGPNVSFF